MHWLRFHGSAKQQPPLRWRRCKRATAPRLRNMATYEINSPNEQGITVSTVVAIDRNKNSQHAVRWAVDNLGLPEKLIILLHVSTHHHFHQYDHCEGRSPTQHEMQQIFLPYRGFCARKGIRTKELILHDTDIARALSEFISANSVNNIVIGASSRGAIARAFKNADIATSLGKIAPDFCSVYAVSKGKTLKIKSSIAKTSMPKNAAIISHDVPTIPPKSPLRESDVCEGFSQPKRSLDKQALPTETPCTSGAPSPQYSVTSIESMHLFPWENHHGNNNPTPPESARTSSDSANEESKLRRMIAGKKFSAKSHALQHSVNFLNLRGRAIEGLPHYSFDRSSDHSEPQSCHSDISYEHLDEPRISDSSTSSTSTLTAELEEELKRTKLELKEITEKYNAACQEAVTAREKIRDLVQRRSDEVSNMAQAKRTEEAAFAIVERENQKCKAAIEIAHNAKIMAELESKKRKLAEQTFKIEAEEKQKVLDALGHTLAQYRRYSIDEIEAATNHFSDSDKIGEGSYGPVYKGTIGHTPVAIKVLKSDIPDGLKQFQQEVEVLSCIRHPNMVILLGACPQYGCLVYEYMENGCLEDQLFSTNATPPLPWTTRFSIAAEIATALNFLHQTKPEALVHRDLKPGNILLDRNFVSKISDVGLSRLLPPSVAENVTQYRMTAAAGTFCYIDPEYQQTGMLGTSSDIYSLGIILLQLITAKPPMGLTHQVESAIKTGRFADILDQRVKDWPLEETLSLAKLALKCSELRRRDRPNLDSVILPELERLRDIASRFNAQRRFYYFTHSQVPSFQESSSSCHQETTCGMQTEDHSENA